MLKIFLAPEHLNWFAWCWRCWLIFVSISIPFLTL
jgi:hypothetical protein